MHTHASVTLATTDLLMEVKLRSCVNMVNQTELQLHETHCGLSLRSLQSDVVQWMTEAGLAQVLPS